MIQSHNISSGQIVTLTNCITSDVTAVCLISTWWPSLTLSPCHLQGGNAFWWFQQGTETDAYHTPSGRNHPGGPAAPGRLLRKSALLQSSCSGMGFNWRSGPTHNCFSRASGYPWVRRPLNTWGMAQGCCTVGCYGLSTAEKDAE